MGRGSGIIKIKLKPYVQPYMRQHAKKRKTTIINWGLKPQVDVIHN